MMVDRHLKKQKNARENDTATTTTTTKKKQLIANDDDEYAYDARDADDDDAYG